MKISVVIPVYNESSTIDEIIDRVRKVRIADEIVIVDDASIDGTGELLRARADEVDLVLLRHDENLGKGAALRTAFGRVSGDIVLIQDADLEYDPRDYPRLLQPIL